VLAEVACAYATRPKAALLAGRGLFFCLSGSEKGCAEPRASTSRERLDISQWRKLAYAAHAPHFLLNFIERVELHFAMLIHKDVGDPRITMEGSALYGSQRSGMAELISLTAL
jgi:hypothetical protein